MIKYRVYDTQEKKYRDDLYFFIAPNGELLWSYELTDGLYPTDPQRFIIEQYTGLEDEYGVEICEGDIVQVETSLVGEVMHSNEYACFEIVGPGFPPYSFAELTDAGTDIDGMVVIGNIHENSDLLEEVG